MKPDDFERRLERQPMRPVPPGWRAEILRAAERAAPRRWASPASGPMRWWREWLWPCPPAWAGMAAAWLVTLVLNLTVAPAPGSAVQNSAPLTPQAVTMVIQERRLLAQLLNPPAADVAEPPKPPWLTPRSERRPLFHAA
jgi:hypothetical protein